MKAERVERDLTRVAVVVPDLAVWGGVPSVARFLCRVLEESDRYEPMLVSLAVSSTDAFSVRVLNPRSWLRGVKVHGATWEGRPYVHVGARLAEFEFMRYAPRRQLTEILDTAHIVQVVAGTPSWSLPAIRSRVPVLLHVATLAAKERERRHRVEKGLRAVWRWGMTRLTTRLDRVALCGADRILAMNSSLERYARRVADPGRVILAPPGVDVNRFHPPAPKDPPSAEDYVLSVARFGDLRKNCDLLFLAYAMLKERTPSAPSLWLAGSSDPPESAWRIARQHGVAHEIRYMGNVSEEELPGLYRNATLFMLSSDEEGFGLALVEAMASGVPVVSTDCGGPGDIVTHGEDGFLVPVGDARALADAARRLLGAPSLRSEMGTRARRTVVTRFSIRVSGDRFLREYDAVLNGVVAVDPARAESLLLDAHEA